MTIRVDITNHDDVILYVEDGGEIKRLLPGESGTFYVKKDNRIRLREDMRAKDRYTPSQPAPDRRRHARRHA